MQDFNPTPAPAQSQAVGSRQRINLRFVGSGSEYFRIWVVNLLLTLVSFGLYYPVAKLRRLRYFYGNTELGGHAFSFHAQATKMLKGYLLVGGLVAAYSAAGRLSPTAGAVAFVVLAVIWPVLWYSSLRFRLANTGWRGLRFAFTGTKAGAYMALLPGYVMTLGIVVAGLFEGPAAQNQGDSLLGGLLRLTGGLGGLGGLAARPEAPLPASQKFVLGLMLLIVLALPWLYWLLRRYQHQHYAVAGERSQFTVGLMSFYGVGLRIALWSLWAWLVLAVLLGLMFFLSAKAGITGGLGADGGVSLGVVWRVLLGGLIAMVVYQVLMRPYVMSRMQNLVWTGTSSQHLNFESDLQLRPLMALSLKNWLLILLSLGLYFPFAAVALARLRLQAVTVWSSLDPDELLADASARHDGAAGDAAGDLLGLDIGL
jgi:uncharacterized membrane protein YjgN (DUF898 family)